MKFTLVKHLVKRPLTRLPCYQYYRREGHEGERELCIEFVRKHLGRAPERITIEIRKERAKGFTQATMIQAGSTKWYKWCAKIGRELHFILPSTLKVLARLFDRDWTEGERFYFKIEEVEDSVIMRFTRAELALLEEALDFTISDHEVGRPGELDPERHLLAKIREERTHAEKDSK